MRRIAIFEDEGAGALEPLSTLRPLCELRCGHFSVRERWLRFAEVTDWGAFVRPHLQHVYREEHPDSFINDPHWLAAGPTLFVNARWLPDFPLEHDWSPDEVGHIDNQIVWMVVDADEAVLLNHDGWADALLRIAETRRPVAAEGTLIRHPWHLVQSNARQLEYDFLLRRSEAAPLPGDVAVLGSETDVYIDPTAQLDPYVVIDARSGPVWIDAAARVQAFTRLEGPCYIGRETQLFRANIRGGTSIGPVCRIGGEIEESILHGYVNKYHDGFVGHSYVCPWVNLGALTTGSDLKNDYSAVRVPVQGTPVDTGSTKVGAFIGDHTKTALCSLMNTGSSIGVMAMILPGGGLLPKHIPSFSRLWHGRLESLPLGGLTTSIEAARTAMGRRNIELTPAMQRLLQHEYDRSAAERDEAIERDADRRRRRRAQATVA